ncbi:MAG TPA: hypothetical protein VMD05_05470 [Candidatus Nanoarchaeia archaeon]|nr:hypothetical protein [Candidatus Nanoarchaeia archaeon]
MKKKTAVLISEEDLRVDLTFHNVSASLLKDFAQKIVVPYYHGNLSAAIQDLMDKTVSEQDFIFSHITHVRDVKEKHYGRRR